MSLYRDEPTVDPKVEPKKTAPAEPTMEEHADALAMAASSAGHHGKLSVLEWRQMAEELVRTGWKMSKKAKE